MRSSGFDVLTGYAYESVRESIPKGNRRAVLYTINGMIRAVHLVSFDFEEPAVVTEVFPWRLNPTFNGKIVDHHDVHQHRFKTTWRDQNSNGHAV